MENKTEITRKVQELYFSLYNKYLDPTAFNYIVSMIVNKSTTLEEYKNLMLKSTEYKTFLNKKFTDVYVDIIDYDKTKANDSFEDFYSKVLSEGTVVTLEDIKSFIKQSNDFYNKYQKLIKSLYELNNVPMDSRIDAFIEKFKNIENYDIDQLSRDIIDTSEIQKATIAPQLGNMVINHFGYIPSFDELEVLLKSTTEANKESDNTSVVYEDEPLTSESIDAFEAVFKRPMFVQEYKKYNNEEDWDMVYKTHIDRLNKFRDIFNKFVGIIPTEYKFVKTYLFTSDEPNFFDSLVDKLISCSDYELIMKKILRDKFMSMFDIEPTKDDIAYMFDIVKTTKIGIMDDDLIKIIHQVKKETDDISSNIFKVFVKVLDRHPDVFELETFINYYRKNPSSLKDNNVYLESTLMQSLEFHDIIKQHIKIVYDEKHGRSILPSTLFDVLNKVIKKLQNMTMDDLDAQINTII